MKRPIAAAALISGVASCVLKTNYVQPLDVVMLVVSLLLFAVWFGMEAVRTITDIRRSRQMEEPPEVIPRRAA